MQSSFVGWGGLFLTEYSHFGDTPGPYDLYLIFLETNPNITGTFTTKSKSDDHSVTSSTSSLNESQNSFAKGILKENLWTYLIGLH